MKRINPKYFSVYLSAFLLSILFLSCQDYRDIKPLSSTGTVNVSADENLETAVESLKVEFERLNPDARVNVSYIPTRNAVAELVNNQTNMIIITRPFDEEESRIINEFEISIDSHKVAIDAIGFIVNPENPVTRVTSEDLRKIFTGEITKWTEIRSQHEEQNSQVQQKMTGNLNNIKVYIQRRNSGTYDYVQSKVLKGEQYFDKSVMCSTSAQMLDEIRNNRNAIGITNLSWLGIGEQEVLDTTVKALRISVFDDETGAQKDFVRLHQGYVFNAEYPYTRIVYLYTTYKGVGVETGFISFLLQTPGQQVLLKHGLVPATQPVRTIQLN